MSSIKTLPVPDLLYLDPGPEMPNNQTLPVVLVRGAAIGLSARAICQRMQDNGWRGTWVWSVFDFHHYHPDAHEALCVARGHATLMLGGVSGVAVTVKGGDLIVLPAGTGHCRRDASPEFAICGAYPPDQTQFITSRASPYALEDTSIIDAVSLPETDPIFGAGGPLVTAWIDARKGA